jgi:hypothetical protein
MATKPPVTKSGKKEHLWALIGKVFVSLAGTGGLVALVAQGISIYDRFAAPAAAPAAAAAKVESLVVKISSAYFQAPPMIPDDGHERTLQERARDSQSEYRYSGYFDFEIENVGAEQVEEVLLTLPYVGVARIRSEGKPTQEILFGSSISLGSLAPSRKVSIDAWTTEFPSSSRNKEIRVTHSKGVAHIKSQP